MVNALNTDHFRSVASVFDILLISRIWFAPHLKLLPDVNLLKIKRIRSQIVWTVDCIFKYEQALVQPQSIVPTAPCPLVIRATFWSPFWGVTWRHFEAVLLISKEEILGMKLSQAFSSNIRSPNNDITMIILGLWVQFSQDMMQPHS